jgi:putative ABC transport system permease protein
MSVHARVPLARRALFQDRRRAALAAGGVAAALLLVLLLQGIVDGAIRQVTAYLRSSPADVVVSARDVRTMHMSLSTLEPATPAAVAAVDGVAWAEGIRFTTTSIVGPAERRQLSYVIGYDTTTGRAGPRSLTTGQNLEPGGILLEEVAADRLGARVGDSVEVLGRRWRVDGTFRGGTTITNSTAFVTAADFAAQRGDALAYVLAGAEAGIRAEDLAERVSAAVPALTVQTRAQFAREEANLVKDMSADLMQIMSAVALLIALAVIALTLFGLTTAKLSEHAVVKALGAPTRRVVGVVLAQAAWSVGLALTAAVGAAVAFGALVERVAPAVAIAVEPPRVVRLAVVGLVIGVLGALVPLRRVVTVDPASAFRRAA